MSEKDVESDILELLKLHFEPLLQHLHFMTKYTSRVPHPRIRFYVHFTFEYFVINIFRGLSSI